MRQILILFILAVGAAVGVDAQSVPEPNVQPVPVPVRQADSPVYVNVPQDVVSIARIPENVLWAQASADVLTALQRTGKLTAKQREAMAQAEAGLSERQKFLLRLDGLAQLAKR